MDPLKKRTNTSTPESNNNNVDETMIPIETNNRSYIKRHVWSKEDADQWDQERAMALNEKARWFTFIVSLLMDGVLIALVIEATEPKTENQMVLKARAVKRFILLGALVLLGLIQAVYLCLISMWPVNMLVERALLGYSCSIAGAVTYSFIYQFLTSEFTNDPATKI